MTIGTEVWRQDLSRELQQGVEEIRANMARTGVNASGRTSAAVQQEATERGGRIVAPSHIVWLEQGIPPLGGDHTREFQATLEQWIVDKGLPVADERDRRAFAWKIERKLRESGAWPWRDGAPRRPPLTDIFTDTLTALAERVQRSLAAKVFTEVQSLMTNIFGNHGRE